VFTVWVAYDSCSCVEDALQLVCRLLRCTSQKTDTVVDAAGDRKMHIQTDEQSHRIYVAEEASDYNESFTLHMSWTFVVIFDLFSPFVCIYIKIHVSYILEF